MSNQRLKLNRDASVPTTTAVGEVDVGQEIAKLPPDDIRVYLKGIKKLRDGFRNRKELLESDLLYEESKAPLQLSKYEELEAEFKANVQDVFSSESKKLLKDNEEDTKLPEDLFTKIKEYFVLKKSLLYSQRLKKLLELNESLKIHLGNSNWDSLENCVKQLNDISRDIHGTSCVNFLTFVSEFRTNWLRYLEEKLHTYLSGLLLKINWPFENSQAINYHAPSVKELQSLLSLLRSVYTEERRLLGSENVCPSEWDPTTPFVVHLLGPFQKRFRYHFYGDRRTNAPDKPEWFFTQILEWINIHREFLRVVLQKEVAGEGVGWELVRALVGLAVEKVSQVLVEVKEDPTLFSHLIDETVVFEMELRALGWGENEGSVLEAFAERGVLEVWIQMEKNFNTEKVEFLLSLPSAWQHRYEDAIDLDEFKVPECADAFLLLLQLITERYRLLHSLIGRYQFLSLQLGLLDDFRVRLVQINRNALSPWECPYVELMNAVAYIAHVLDEWNDLPFFIQLQGYKYQDILNEEGKRPQRVFEGAFDQMIGLYRLLWRQMQKEVVYALVHGELSPLLNQYRKEKWHALGEDSPDQSGSGRNQEAVANVSASFCPFLLCLREKLSFLHLKLSPVSFAALLSEIADGCAELILSDLIGLGHSYFNQLGGIQLRHDILSALLPLLKSYGVVGLEGSMAQLIESLQILAMKHPMAKLLLESVKQHGDDEMPSLETDFQVYFLKKKNVEALLGQRVDVRKI